MLNVWQNNFKATLAQSRDRVAHDLNAKRWDYIDPELNKQVVPTGMKLLVKQLLLVPNEVNHHSECSSSFETINGIPCYHTIRELKRLNVKITKNHINKHWHFNRPVQSPADGEAMVLPPEPAPPPGPSIFAPHVVRTRGRPRRRRGEENTTRRGPSRFEINSAPPASRPGRLGGEVSRVCIAFLREESIQQPHHYIGTQFTAYHQLSEA
jgi:hypothetical protein